MTASRSDALVLFGVTGDLAHKMIFPALYAMAKRGTLEVPVIGVAFPKWSLARLNKRVTDSIKRSGGSIQSLRPTTGLAPTRGCSSRVTVKSEVIEPVQFPGCRRYGNDRMVDRTGQVTQFSAITVSGAG
jgi:hypothetical protein